MKNFTPLMAALANYFEKSFTDIPKEQSDLIEETFYPRHWDRLTPEQRKQHAARWDYENNPDNQDRINALCDLVAGVHEKRIELMEWQSLAAPYPSEHERKTNKIKELSAELTVLEEKLHAARGDDPTVDPNTSAHTGTAVTADWIRANFVLFNHEDKSDQWWKEAMANASRNKGLLACRLGHGIKGKSGTLWFPDRIALWLIDRQERGLSPSMTARRAIEALAKFDGYAKIIEDLKELYDL